MTKQDVDPLAQMRAIQNMGDEVGALFTVQQVCDIFGVRIHSVYRWIKEGDLPAIRLGGLDGRGPYRIRAEDIKELMARWMTPTGKTR